MAAPQNNPARRLQQPLGRLQSPTPTDTTISLRCSPNSVQKFNPFHDALGRFANKHGFKTYSANPKTNAGAKAIWSSARGGHGRTLNVHRESKGESIQQNANWLVTGQKPAVPAAVSRARYQQRKLKQQQQQQQQAANQKQNQPADQKPTPPPKQTPQTSAGGVASGKAAHAVDGQDLSGKFQFNKQSTDYAIEQVIKAQGFDGKPTLTSDISDFASACKASDFIAKRGVGASDQRTLDAYDQALKTGDFYVKCSGGSVHGYGMYCASVQANGSKAKHGVKDAEGTAVAYARGNRAQKIYTMTLDKSAKVGTESDLIRQMRNDSEFQSVCRKSGMRSQYTEDVGVYAAYKGYDAYIASSGRTSRDGSRSDYTVILNRSKVIIYDDSNVPF